MRFLRPTIPLLLLLLLLAIPAGCSGKTARTVVLVTVDTLRADHTSAFGYELPTTPALEALAARGTAFDRALCAQPETGPSLASIHTSRHPREIGVRRNGDFLPREFTTLAEAFSAAGYETAAFVSVYWLKPPFCGLDRGFDVYDAETDRPNLGHDDVERLGADTAARAVAWLREHEGESRFLWVHVYDPHGRYEPGPELARRFYRDRGRPDLDPARIQDYQRFGESLDPDDYVARYDGEIRLADDAVGEVLAAAGPDAIVAFTADHGEGLGEHDYWFRHGSRLDTPSLRVPLVLAGPGIPAGARTDRLVRNLDLAPTLLDYAGLPPLAGARGRSLRPELEGRPEGEAPAAFAEAAPSGLLAVTEGRYRLLLQVATRRDLLFDLQTDPGEVAPLPGGVRPEVRARLRARLDAWRSSADRAGSGPGDPALEDRLKSHGYVR